ncbi:hypothetical protein BJ508DRAFT_302782 [Ascobolus immersus RN42]|uniref:Uncharacterized protein n=1 Tax=Ascobolus immersus RN42 TaxID=1160509 RepID=A0A3N4ILD5_ASCIM|nr:hypothetical protein BJ508DRAFT_302782 [Ascobolus immersus RN42]
MACVERGPSAVQLLSLLLCFYDADCLPPPLESDANYAAKIRCLHAVCQNEGKRGLLNREGVEVEDIERPGSEGKTISSKSPSTVVCAGGKLGDNEASNCQSRIEKTLVKQYGKPSKVVDISRAKLFVQFRVPANLEKKAYGRDVNCRSSDQCSSGKQQRRGYDSRDLDRPTKST